MKKMLYGLFSVIILIYYISDSLVDASGESFLNNSVLMNAYNEKLSVITKSVNKDSLLIKAERDQLIQEIEEKLVTYLYEVPDYSYLRDLVPYLKINPQLLDQIPSTVPLEKDDFAISSKYGYRIHPISAKTKKHFGVDFAATSNKHIYATAAGTVSEVIHAKKGYGTHIIVKHRFGFSTFYGHLNKVLVRKGQHIEQHELIATVGTSGSSSGYHLHYEVIKNGLKIDPIYGFNLKRKVYEDILE